ncbi:ABC transporter permease [Candidatus Saccharibacteria bacterium]|nr:ABC transporter permease [Candidatus Saccharibacteria bacterium]
MKYIDSIQRAGSSLKNAKARTTLTALAIAVGAFTLTLSIAAGEGARQYTDELIASTVDTQTLFITRDKGFSSAGGGFSGGIREYSPDTTQLGGATIEAVTQKDIERIVQNKNIESVTPIYMVSAEYFSIEGINKKYVADVTAYDPNILSEVAAGSLPELGEQISDTAVILPEPYISTLPNNPSPESLIGKELTLRIVKPTTVPTDDEIEAAFARGGQEAIRSEFAPETRDVTLKIEAVTVQSNGSLSADGGLLISQTQAKELSDYMTKGTDQYQKYFAVTALVKDGLDPEQVKLEVSQDGLTAQSAKDLQALLFQIVNILQGIVIGFGIIALIASVFGIINTQYISVLERTREIGLMKALGMRGRHVSRLFQLEAAWIGLLGGIIGAVAAWSLGVVLNPWISKTVGLGDNSLLIFQPLPIALLIVALIIIAMLAGWFPAQKAAKLDPIEALRTE